MKYLRIWFIILLYLFLNMEMTTLAMNSGFAKEPLSADELNAFQENFVISVIHAEPQKKAIDCFDVNEKGLIAVGCSDSFTSTKKMICIYSDNGTFLYGYTFKSYGTFGVEWDQDNIIIYLVRGNGAVAINPDGTVESVSRIKKTPDNNSYWRNYIFSTERIIGDAKYTLKNNMGILNLVASSYSQVVVEKNNGEKTIIYDAGIYHFITILVIVVIVLSMMCIVILGITKTFIKHNPFQIQKC